MSSSTDNTEDKQSNLVPFKPGESGNANGRPKGSRNKLGEEFLNALASGFEQHGPAVIVAVRESKPEVYLRVVADLLPKEMSINKDPYEELTDDQLVARLMAARRASDEWLRKRGYLSGEGA